MRQKQQKFDIPEPLEFAMAAGQAKINAETCIEKFSLLSNTSNKYLPKSLIMNFLYDSG